MKYWTYMKGEVPGSFEPAELAALPGFGQTTLVCPASGEIAEKNWRRAGEFDDIVRAIEAREAGRPPAAPLEPPAASSSDVDALLDTASTRLFSHVADLMKELETRRDEKSLIVSLQRQISALKEQLAEAREKITMLELRVPRIAELEEELRKDHASLASLQASVTLRENQAGEYRVSYEKTRHELDAAKQRLQEANNDLAIRNRLVDKLSHDLSEKELSLAKSLGVIRRLEEDLNRLCPSPEMRKPAEAAPAPAPRVEAPRVEAPRAEPPPAPRALPDMPALKPKTAPASAAAESLESVLPVAGLTPLAPPEPVEPPAAEVLSVPELKTPVPPPTYASFTNDDPPPPPPYLEPPVTESPKAHEALMGFLRKVFPGQNH